MDFYLGSDGGYAIPRSSEIGWRMRAYFERMLAKFGVDGLLPVYVESGVYNYYLRRRDVSVKEDAMMPVVAASDQPVARCVGVQASSEHPNGRQELP